MLNAEKIQVHWNLSLLNLGFLLINFHRCILHCLHCAWLSTPWLSWELIVLFAWTSSCAELTSAVLAIDCLIQFSTHRCFRRVYFYVYHVFLIIIMIAVFLRTSYIDSIVYLPRSWLCQIFQITWELQWAIQISWTGEASIINVGGQEYCIFGGWFWFLLFCLI